VTLRRRWRRWRELRACCVRSESADYGCQRNRSTFNGMQHHEHFSSICVFTVLVLMTLLLQGCVSLEFEGKNGRPNIIGFGCAKSIGGTKSQIYQIIAPGVSLRTGSGSPGVSFGLYETRLFYPPTTTSTNVPTEPVAIHTKCIGIDFAPTHVMVGFESAFAVPLPERGKSVIQSIRYSENNPTNTVVERKEIE